MMIAGQGRRHPHLKESFAGRFERRPRHGRTNDPPRLRLPPFTQALVHKDRLAAHFNPRARLLQGTWAVPFFPEPRTSERSKTTDNCRRSAFPSFPPSFPPSSPSSR
jgi:hypothetical protein